MHKNRRLVSLMCVTALLGASVTANTVSAASQQVGADGIKLHGNTACGESGHVVCVDVWAHGKTIADLRLASTRNQYTDIIVYRDEIQSGEGGSYEIVLGLGDRTSGLYDAYIGCDCGETIIEDTVVFSNSDENKIAIGLLNEAAGKEDPVLEIQTVCENYKYALGFISDYTLDSFAAGLIDAHIDALVSENGVGLDINDKEAAITVFEKAVAISAIKSGAVNNLFDASKELYLKDGRLATLYNQNFVTSAFGIYTTDKLKAQSYATITDFEQALYKQFVFSTVKNADGYGDIKKVVSVFKNDIGLGREATDAECLKVMKKEYSSYETLLADMLKNSENGSLDFGITGNVGGYVGSGGSGGFGGSGGGGTISGIGNDLSFSNNLVNPGSAEKINKNIFNDIDSVPWATEAIVELAQRGIISGKGAGLFCPDDNITREEFVKLVVMTFFADAKVADVNFGDVDNSAWYAKYVKMAYAEDVVKGIGDGVFGTGMNITREDMAVIAYRVAMKAGKLAEKELSTEFSFGDDGVISDYAKSAVYALYEAEVINGINASEFAPKQPLTRAQAAKIIYGIYTLK